MKKIKMILWNLMTGIKSLFVKRDMSIVIFGSWFGNRFADNSRYLYQYVSKNKEALGFTHVIWVTRSSEILDELTKKGHEAYLMDSNESIKYHKMAGIHIICNSFYFLDGFESDILTKYSMGAVKINLWHGLGGIKGINYAGNTYLKAKKNAKFKYLIKELVRTNKWYRKCCLYYGGWGDCYYLSVSDFGTQILKKYFMLPDKNYIKTGYPRNTQVLELMDSEREIVNIIKGMQKVALYLPTFRDKGYNYTVPLSNKDFADKIIENGWTWIEKEHGVNQNIVENVCLSNSKIIKLPSVFDINIVLPYVNVVITDYSSVIWDALYHKKPVLFYVPDFDQYMNSDNGFLLEPKEFLIGPVAYDIEELLNNMTETFDDSENNHSNDWIETKRRIWGDEKNISEIWQDIYDICVKGGKG